VSIPVRPEFFDLKDIAENEDPAQAATVTVIGQAKLTEEAA